MKSNLIPSVLIDIAALYRAPPKGLYVIFKRLFTPLIATLQPHVIVKTFPWEAV